MNKTERHQETIDLPNPDGQGYATVRISDWLDDQLIERNMTRKELCDGMRQAGYRVNSPNFISMLRRGESRIPNAAIRPLLIALGFRDSDLEAMSQRLFQAYNPSVTAIYGEAEMNTRERVKKRLKRFGYAV